MSAPAELQIVHLDAMGTVVSTQPMATVPLLAPPQGGWIVLLGARARNLDGCQLTLTTSLVDTVDNQLLQVDIRPTQLELDADGWGVSSATTFSNLPVCPQLTATRNLHAEPYIINVVASDAFGKRATASLTVVPTCPAIGSRCTCECDQNFVVGAECPMAGVAHDGAS